MHKKNFLRLLLIIGFLLLIVIGLAIWKNDTQTLDLTGVYHCHGNDPTANPSYYNTILTVKKQGDVYVMQEIDHGNDNNPNAVTSDNYNELGILDKKTFVVSFQYVNDPKIFGTTVFHVHKEGKLLDGYFYYWNQFNLKGTETCEQDPN